MKLSGESKHEWRDNQWIIPLIGGVSQVVKIGKLPVSLGVLGKYWVEKPDNTPDWGIRFE